MPLDELIAQIRNPQEFTRLCNSVFVDIYGDAFQVIDGTRGDNGNDGYVSSEHRMLAMYCPVKPEQKTDAGYLDKIRGDLVKAAALKRANKYEIDAWTFVTPRKLADDVIARMRSIAAEFGIRAAHQESTFLANELYRRKHLLEGFPALQFIDLGAKIDDLAQIVTAKRDAPHVEPDAASDRQPVINDSAGDARLRQLTEGIPNAEAKSEIKVIAYRTTDPIVEINAILSLFRWFDPADDDRGEFFAFASRGVDRAKRCGLTDAEAVFHAHKVGMLVWDFNTGLVEAHFAAVADFALSFATTPIEQTQQRLTKLRKLEESWKTEFSAAMDLIRESDDHDAVGVVLMAVGTSMGQLAQTYRTLGQSASADRYLTQCKTLLLTAKDAYGAAGDELGTANAVFNLANQLRWHDGTGEAIELVKSTIPLAEKHTDVLLLQKAKWLLHTLETGEIPDYVAGERRAWTEVPPSQRKG